MLNNGACNLNNVEGSLTLNDVKLAMSPAVTMVMSTTANNRAALTTTNDGTLNDQR